MKFEFLIIAISVLSFISTLFALYIAIRNELRKSRNELAEQKLKDEKNRNALESKISLLEERALNLSTNIQTRLNEIEHRLLFITDKLIS